MSLKYQIENFMIDYFYGLGLPRRIWETYAEILAVIYLLIFASLIFLNIYFYKNLKKTWTYKINTIITIITGIFYLLTFNMFYIFLDLFFIYNICLFAPIILIIQGIPYIIEKKKLGENTKKQARIHLIISLLSVYIFAAAFSLLMQFVG
jgi:hypothetical protein